MEESMSRTNRAYWILCLVGCYALISGWTIGSAQRITATGIRTDNGFVWHNGTSAQWLRLRATDVSLPPRTVRYAWATNLQITEGGDPFGRVAVLWSGWGSPGNDDRSEYWIKCLYKLPPTLEAAQVYDTFNCGDGTFKGRIWNEQYFSYQPRSLEVSAYVANAPTPRFASFQQPSWRVLNDDLIPARPGIQLDPHVSSDLVVNANSGQAVLRRDLLSNIPVAAGRDYYVYQNFASPFRDVVDRTLSLLLQVNNDTPRDLIRGGVLTHTWGRNDSNTDRTFGAIQWQFSIPLRNYAIGTRLTLTYTASYTHTPYNKADNPLGAPTREPITDLREGQNLNFDLKGLNYAFSGAFNSSGSVSDAQAPPTCVPKAAGTLNITLNLRNFIPDLPFDLVVTLNGVRVSADTVRWVFDVSPNRCVNIGGVNVLVKRLWGQLTAHLERVPIFWDSVCGQYYNLRLTPVGGNNENWINGELYALCIETGASRINAAVRDINFVAYAGGVFEQNDPRNLYLASEAVVVEIIRYGDTDGNGCVNDNDIIQVLFNFGARGSSLPADVNGDGVVNDSDLLVVILQFGSGC
jgi:hypothetical protein